MSYEVYITVKKLIPGDFIISKKEVDIFQTTLTRNSLAEALAAVQAHLNLVTE